MDEQNIEAEHTDSSDEASVLTEPDSHALPEVLDRGITMEMVQRYVEAERNRSRRILLWISTIFLFVVLLILTSFISIGIFVLQNSRRSTNIVNDFEIQAGAYDDRLGGIEREYAKMSDMVKDTEADRATKNEILKVDLKRFSRWIASNNAQKSEALTTLKNRLREVEKTSEAREKALDLLKQQYVTLLNSASVGQTGSNVSHSQATAPIPIEAEQGKVEGTITKTETFRTNDVVDTAASSLDIEIKSDLPLRPSGTWPEEVQQDLTGEYASIPPDKKLGLNADISIDSPTPAARRHGEITVVTFTNGDRYEGEFVDGRFVGFGFYMWADGKVYAGFWVDDVRHGSGFFIASDGSLYKTYYQRGELIDFEELGFAEAEKIKDDITSKSMETVANYISQFATIEDASGGDVEANEINTRN